jgi:hypothetical protein
MWGKQTTGARIVYDSHELAREEHSESWLWRMLCRPHVCAIEAAGVHDADRVVTVSPGIARLLAETYSLAVSPLVVLNVPEYRSVETHPPLSLNQRCRSKVWSSPPLDPTSASLHRRSQHRRFATCCQISCSNT